MHITHIDLLTFRNYHQLAYDPEPGVNVLVGKNAQGKTNLLEGIYLCCIGKSHRAKRDVEMIGREPGAKNAYCGVTVQRRDGYRTVEVMLLSLIHIFRRQRGICFRKQISQYGCRLNGLHRRRIRVDRTVIDDV